MNQFQILAQPEDQCPYMPAVAPPHAFRITAKEFSFLKNCVNILNSMLIEFCTYPTLKTQEDRNHHSPHP